MYPKIPCWGHWVPDRLPRIKSGASGMTASPSVHPVAGDGKLGEAGRAGLAQIVGNRLDIDARAVIARGVDLARRQIAENVALHDRHAAALVEIGDRDAGLGAV